VAIPLKDILYSIVYPKNNWKTQLLAQWKTIVGPLENKVYIEKIYDDTLVLGVFHSCWMQELYLLAPLFIKKINEKLDEPYIKQIRFKHSGTKKEKSQKKKPVPLIKKNVALTKKDESTLNKITDPALKEALKAFRLRCYQES
jgi:hypothetical protein